jgi:hypothetical protein
VSGAWSVQAEDELQSLVRSVDLSAGETAGELAEPGLRVHDRELFDRDPGRLASISISGWNDAGRRPMDVGATTHADRVHLRRQLGRRGDILRVGTQAFRLSTQR